MQRAVVGRPGGWHAGPEPDRTGHGQPRVAPQQCDRDEPGHPRDADRASRSVVASQPGGQPDQGDADDPRAGLEPRQRDQGARDEQPSEADEGRAGRRRQSNRPRQLEPLAGDGQDQERSEPRDDGVDSGSGEPQRSPDDPCAGAGGLGPQVDRRLDPVEREVDRHEREPTGQQQRHPQLDRGAGRQEQRTQARSDGRQVAPAATERHGPLERDHGPEEAERHQHAMGRELGRCEPGRNHAQQRERAPQPAPERYHGQAEHGQGADPDRLPRSCRRRRGPRCPKSRHHQIQPSCARPRSVIRSGLQGGSWVSTTSTSSTPSIASAAQRTSSSR